MSAPVREVPTEPMTSGEFLAWLARQDEGARHELVAGRIVTMNAERARHAAVKLDVALALRLALTPTDLGCTVFGDGMSVVIDEHDTWEPDVSVQCGIDWDPDSIELEAPLIVVEVLSPSTKSTDTGAKLAGYLGLDSVRHYLIADPVRRMLIHHSKASDGTIATRIVREGSLELDPPGIAVDVATCFASLASRD